MSLAPAWLFTVSRFNPFVYVVDATRAAFIGNLDNTTVLIGVGVAVALSIRGPRPGTARGTPRRASGWHCVYRTVTSRVGVRPE
jgi:hypothetical protein